MLPVDPHTVTNAPTPAEQLRMIADSLPVLIAYVDAAHRYQFNNRGYQDWFGQDPAVLRGMHLREALGQAAYTALLPKLEAALRGEAVTFEAEVPYQHGGVRVVRAMYIPHTDEQGRTLGFYALVTDMTEHQAAAEALRRSEEKYRTLFSSIDEGFCICQMLLDEAGQPRDYRFLEVNPTFEQHTGLHDPVGKTALELVPNLEPYWIDLYGRVALTGEPARFVQGSEAMDSRWFDVYAFRLGRPEDLRFALLFSDITARRQAEEKLRRTQARLESALKAGLAGTFYWDWRSSRIITDENMMRYFSLSAQALDQGVPLDEVLPAVHADDRPRVEQALAEAAERTGEYQVEYRVLHSDGRHRWLSARGLAERDGSGQAVGLAGFAVDVTERKLAEEERVQYARRLEDQVAARTTDLRGANAALERSQDELRRLSAYLQQVREEERTSMAREIHDELGQQLTGLKMDVAQLRKRLDPPTAGEALTGLTSAIDEAIQTVRRLASELRPSILDDFGLVAAMEAHLGEFERRAGVTARLTAQADETSLSADTRTALFRIFQEALTNIARHAGATAVTVSLAARDGQLALEVRDDGRGITERDQKGVQSLGLLGMRERVRLLGGELVITGAPGQGTVVRVTVPH